ncbi:hypothetical protein [Marinilabilia salmonicolor]|uniref:hypothetical protein n=1 Tax=Marinilabilia salmonicolor TaxID=989 RepID=UPI0011E06D1D|nr:hypothetical protein [Marinilabilia salmonicolor]
MRNIVTLILVVFIISLTNCTSNSGKNESLISEKFYKKQKDSFLKSDLTKFDYNPRTNFTYGNIDSSNYYRVLIFRDSSIRIFGTDVFSELFNVPINDFSERDVIVSKSETNYMLTDPYDDKKVKIIKNTTDSNVVDYFLDLEKLILKYQILEIDKHSQVNTLKIVFSDNDYLIYKPDSLVFKSSNKEYMKYLFENGKEIDKNWIHFTDKTNIDYY